MTLDEEVGKDAGKAVEEGDVAVHVHNSKSSNGEKNAIVEDHVSGPTIPDRGSAVATRQQRTIIFFVLCQAVQMFMSYDSGATSASLDTIREAKPGYWTTSDLSLLGAMDKIGTTAASVIWGRLLQLFPTKCLLVLALGTNAACTLLFGLIDDKYAMFSTKFAMGATQALQNVWGSVWTVTMAPPDCVTMWMALGGISAAVGTGLGSAMAGFGTANGMPYSFAFIVQACMLGGFWLFQVLTPQSKLAMALPESSEETSPKGSSDTVSGSSGTLAKASMWTQLRDLWHNKVYVWTLIATCLNQFQVQAVQYFFILIFGEAWGLDKNYTTTMTIVVPGIGMGIGIAFGPAYIDKKGGFTSPPGMKRTLIILRQVCILVGLGSSAGIGALYGKLRSIDRLEVQAPTGANNGDLWLYGVWLSIIVVFAGHSFCVAALSGINTETVPGHMRSFASGIETSFRNLFGYFAGTLLPGVFMDIVAATKGWDVSDTSESETVQRDLTNLYCAGLMFIFSFGVPCFFVMHNAVRAATNNLLIAQEDAMQRLRAAFMADKLKEMKAALEYAKQLELQRTRDGEAVMGAVNEVIGEINAVGSSKMLFKGKSRRQIQCTGATRDELIQRVNELEGELAFLRPKNESLAARVRELEEQVQLLRPNSEDLVAQAMATNTLRTL